ncbi:MAG: hypothetical protein NXI10_02700 [bacterium]|nr:hypothetical protein [bacterium]
MGKSLLTYLFIAVALSGRTQVITDSIAIPTPIRDISDIRDTYEYITYKGRIGYYNFDFDLFPPTRHGILTHHTLKPITLGGHRRFQALSSKETKWRPLADFNGFGGNPNSTDFEAGYRAGAGVYWRGHFKDKWNFHLAGVAGTYDGDSSYMPRSYFNWQEGNRRLYTDIRSRISFSPNKIFNFQTGIDHNHIGEGLRSLFISDYGNPYPFGMIKANFWRVEYSILYQFMREGMPGNWKGKFASSHHISFNAAKWLNIGVFETVIFNPGDTLLNRGFDVEYLNPVVFYRPQEYSIGSSDNVLLGLDLTARHKNYTFYSQFIIDEFVLSEIRARSQWWANKYGGQFGLKANFKKGNHVFFARTEMNFVRPYTYAHLNDKLNHGNQGRPLAHPYGANFAEVLGEVRWARNNWRGQFFMNYSQRGGDTDSINYGADIYLPYINRPEDDFGHFIGQGNARNSWLFRWRIAFKLEKFYWASIFAEYNLRYTVQTNEVQNLFSIGLRSNLWNDYRNY